MYHCSRCGAVYYFDRQPPDCHCAPGSTFVPITITARANEYTEAGGEITGIEVDISVDG
jgi:hypothetical protein